MLKIEIPNHIVAKYIAMRNKHYSANICSLKVKERVQRCNDFLTAKQELEFYLYSAIEELE